MAEAEDLKSLQCRFDPDRGYKGDNMNIFVVNIDPEKQHVNYVISTYLR